MWLSVSHASLLSAGGSGEGELQSNSFLKIKTPLLSPSEPQWNRGIRCIVLALDCPTRRAFLRDVPELHRKLLSTQTERASVPSRGLLGS